MMKTHERHVSRSFQKFVSTIAFVTMLSTGVRVDVASAQELVTSTNSTLQTVTTDTAPIMLPPPQAEDKKAVVVDESKPKTIKTMRVPMTSYTSAVEECDDSPFTAADGTRTYNGMAAANFLPFGTKFRVPEYFGDKIFTVHDRMNSRYGVRIDIWTERKADAKKFGVKKAALIEIVEMGNGKTSWKKQVTTSQVAVK